MQISFQSCTSCKCPMAFLFEIILLHSKCLLDFHHHPSLGRDHWSIGGQHEVDARIRHQIGLEPEKACVALKNDRKSREKNQALDAQSAEKSWVPTVC